jgi:hypothetical protein
MLVERHARPRRKLSQNALINLDWSTRAMRRAFFRDLVLLVFGGECLEAILHLLVVNWIEFQGLTDKANGNRRSRQDIDAEVARDGVVVN